MSKPIVAVVGRPNVGKSTLFNKLCGQRLAIVEDTPGITRDRIFANCEWSGHEFMLVDTGGIEPKATEGILAHMREQAEIAIDTADCIIMVVDVRDGLTAADEEVAHMLRRSHKPIILAVNKCDKTGEAPMELYEFYNLGFDEVMPISSVHGHGTGDLLDAVCAHLDFSETVVEEDRIPVAIIGRPNVGKSSLTNLLVGEKVAIVTSKPQTTRTRITGVITRGPLQYVLLDTPGVHKARNKLGKRMDKTASDSIADVDVSMMLFEPYGALNESEMVLVDMLRSSGGPAIAVINKTDLVKDAADLEARKEELKALGVFDDIYTVSVRNEDGCETLFDALSRYAVEGPHYFDDDAYTDMPEKELVAEVIREKALLFMRDEIPHGIAVVVERFKERPGTDLIDIDVNIYCERESHKGMVIGKGGAMLKKIASAARADCEEFLGCRVNLQCWVKVKSDWRDNEFLLNNFGFKQNTNNR